MNHTCSSVRLHQAATTVPQLPIDAPTDDRGCHTHRLSLGTFAAFWYCKRRASPACCACWSSRSPCHPSAMKTRERWWRRAARCWSSCPWRAGRSGCGRCWRGCWLVMLVMPTLLLLLLRPRSRHRCVHDWLQGWGLRGCCPARCSQRCCCCRCPAAAHGERWACPETAAAAVRMVAAAVPAATAPGGARSAAPPAARRRARPLCGRPAPVVHSTSPSRLK